MVAFAIKSCQTAEGMYNFATYTKKLDLQFWLTWKGTLHTAILVNKKEAPILH